VKWNLTLASLLLAGIALATAALRAECGPLEPLKPLQISGALCGTASDLSGALYSDAELVLFSESGKVEAEARTDSKGRFIFPGVSVGRYFVGAPGFVRAWPGVEITTANARTCKRGVIVELIVSGDCPSKVSTGAGLRLRVNTRIADVLVDGYRFGTTFDGRFERFELVPGLRHIEVRAPGYETLAFDVTIREYRTTVYRGVLKRRKESGVR
jgi:hypothetical protein